MTQIFKLTQSYVENYDLDNHSWFSFSQKCTQKEFLKSQKGFYYAVKSFPMILANLASKIDSSEARLLVIENLWEEHGHGDNNRFHTSTYFQYLQSLGYNKKQGDIEHQPWVDEWIKVVLNKDYSGEQYAMYIAGIEYIYARISQFIATLIKSYSLHNSQSHYANHAVLDYEHSKELIQTSLLIQQEDKENYLSDDDMMTFFTLGISEFLDLYHHMVFLTEVEAVDISKEQHAFYYGREDTSVNKLFLDSWHNCHIQSSPAKILMICSGGENAIDILSSKKNYDITLLDINPHQLNLAKKKIECIKETGSLSEDLTIFTVGKFEKLFSFLKSRFTLKELQCVAQKDSLALEKFKWICDNVFSNRILEIIFTENATKYSKDNFADHFYQLFVRQITWFFETQPQFSNIGSILFNTPPINYHVKINPQSCVSYYHGDFLSFFDQARNNNKPGDNFDLIDLSNISDWMPFEQMQKIVSTAFSRLNMGGVIVGRKLLGDYKWSDLQHGLSPSIIVPIQDKTLFYTECVFIQKT